MSFLGKIFQRTATKKVAFFLLMDIAFLALAMFVSFLLRFDGAIPFSYRQYLWHFIGLALLLYLPVFWWQGLYGLSWSYVSVAELVKIVKAVIYGTLFFGAALFSLRPITAFSTFPRSIILVNFFLVLILVGGLRSLKRIYYEVVHQERLVDKTRSEDLIVRDPVELDKKLISQFLFQKKVLVTGAAGSVGQELIKQIIPFRPKELVLIDQDETGIFNLSCTYISGWATGLNSKDPPLTEPISQSGINFQFVVGDILDKAKMERVFQEYQPEVVFHAAAYKHVPVMEQNPCEAVRNNVGGTWILAKAAIKNQTSKFVLISTDKAVNPTSVMGASKRVAEMLISYLNKRGVTKFMAVRFGNVLGSRGSVVPIFQEQIKRGGPLTITHPDMERYFMMASEACQLVIQAGASGQGGEIFALDMGKPIKITDLAYRLIQMSGLRPQKDIKIVFTGLRPGEKITEEILTAEEGIQATQYRKIYLAGLRADLADKELLLLLHDLMVKARQGDAAAVKVFLHQIVKTYGS